MYLTIKFVADGMMEPRILAVCNLSIKTDEPEIVKRAYHDTILETYTNSSAALVSVNDNVLLADNNNVLIIPLKKKGTYHVEYNQ